MIQYILPPVIIVVSFSFLIFFLFKKLSQVPAHEISGRTSGGERDIPKKSFLRNFWLGFLERWIQRIKLFSLRFHNASNRWFHKVKQQREGSEESVQKTEVKPVYQEKSVRQDKPVRKDKPVHLKEHSVEKVEISVRKPKEKSVRVEPSFSEGTKGRMDMKQRPALPQQEEPKKEEKESIIKFKRSPRVRRGNLKIKEEKFVPDKKVEEGLINRIAENPKDIEAYQSLGDYYLKCNNKSDAAECFRQVLKLSPVNYKARIRLRTLEKDLRK